MRVVFRPLTLYQRIVDIVVGAAFALAGVATVPVEYVMVANEGSVGWGIVVAVGFGAALACRRWSPGLALAAAWLFAIVQMLAIRPPGFSDIAIFGVLYATAAYGSRRVFWLGFTSTIVGAVAIAAYLFAVPVFGGQAAVDGALLSAAAASTLAAFFALGLSWTTGALVRMARRARENREAHLRAEQATATEQERVRIARDMHDVVAHSLAVVIAQADGARYAAKANPQAAPEALSTISSTARGALSDVRLLLTQLRHSQADGPQPTLTDLETVYAQVRAAGVALRVEVDPAPPGEPPAAIQLAVYRIVQEALTNALRHGSDSGGGSGVDVRIAWHPDRVDLTIRNASTRAPGGPGHGILGMRERAQLVGGRLDAGLEDDEFVVRATMPIGVPA